MKRIAILAVAALALGAGTIVGTAPARADEPIGYGRSVGRGSTIVRRHVVHRLRRIVREVIVERPVYRTRVVREVIIERPVYRPRRIVREVFFDPYDVGPPPFAYGPPPRFGYGPRLFRPPLRPVGFAPGFGYGPRFFRPPLRPVGFGPGFGCGPGFGYGPFF